jgi:hypothetical protein
MGSVEKKPRSGRSSKGCCHRFVNNSRSSVKVIWLDYDGEEVVYAILEPSRQHAQGGSYTRLPWTESHIAHVYVKNYKLVPSKVITCAIWRPTCFIRPWQDLAWSVSQESVWQKLATLGPMAPAGGQLPCSNMWIGGLAWENIC